MANNKNMNDYLHRMLVPPGFRPQSDEDIEKVLDAFDEGPLDLEIVERVLGKSKSEILRSYDSADFDTTSTVQDGDNFGETVREVDSETLGERFAEFRRLVVECSGCRECTVKPGGMCDDCVEMRREPAL